MQNDHEWIVNDTYIHDTYTHIHVHTCITWYHPGLPLKNTGPPLVSKHFTWYHPGLQETAKAVKISSNSICFGNSSHTLVNASLDMWQYTRKIGPHAAWIEQWSRLDHTKQEEACWSSAQEPGFLLWLNLIFESIGYKVGYKIWIQFVQIYKALCNIFWSNLMICNHFDSGNRTDRFLPKTGVESLDGEGPRVPCWESFWPIPGAVPGAPALGANDEELEFLWKLGVFVSCVFCFFLRLDSFLVDFKTCKTWWCLDDIYLCVHSKDIFEDVLNFDSFWFIWNEGEKWKRTKFTYWRHNRKICSSKQPGSWQHALIKHLKPHRQQRTMSGHAASCQMERDTDLIRRTTVVFDRDFIISAGIR